MCGTEGLTVPKNSSSNADDNVIKAPTKTVSPDAILNFEQGDPAVFVPYWQKRSDECTVVIKGADMLSYITDTSNICWFMLPQLRDSIKRLHRVVGNAVTEDKHIVVGTGATQLFQAALFAISSPDMPNADPISVVAAAPYYSEYKEEVEYLQSGLYKWGGDANVFDNNNGAYIEVLTSPNNPDGTIRKPVVQNSGEGKLIFDLAYYWPQYTPITEACDHDIMLFTFSKCTGYAGSRIGWAIVKDIEVAKKMTRFVQMSSLGVSRESQLRATKIMGVICDGYDNPDESEHEHFFEYGKRVLSEKWRRLREAIKHNEVFALEEYPKGYCHSSKRINETTPAFAWLECKQGDCQVFLKGLRILARGGRRFGGDQKYSRVSMLSNEALFNELLRRVANTKVINDGSKGNRCQMRRAAQ